MYVYSWYIYVGYVHMDKNWIKKKSKKKKKKKEENKSTVIYLLHLISPRDNVTFWASDQVKSFII